MEAYIQKALEFEDDFNRRVKKSSLPRPGPDCMDADGILTLPVSHLFLPEETIAVKIHRTRRMGHPRQDNRPFLHRHDFFEFNYIYRGRVENILIDRTLIQTSDQLLLMNPHGCHDPKIVDPDTVLFNILVERNWAETVFANLLTFNERYFHFFMDMLYGAERQEDYLVFDCTPEVTALIHAIIREYYDQSPCYQQMLTSQLMSLFVCCTRQSYEQHLEEEQKQMQRKTITDVLIYLRSHYAEATLSNTAREFGYSPSYLSRLIKQETNMNFSEILRNLRLENACNYLKYSSLPLELITEHIGYKDPGHFTKAFCQVYGMTPSQYRKEQK